MSYFRQESTKCSDRKQQWLQKSCFSVSERVGRKRVREDWWSPGEKRRDHQGEESGGGGGGKVGGWGVRKIHWSRIFRMKQNSTARQRKSLSRREDWIWWVKLDWSNNKTRLQSEYGRREGRKGERWGRMVTVLRWERSPKERIYIFFSLVAWIIDVIRRGKKMCEGEVRNKGKGWTNLTMRRKRR